MQSGEKVVTKASKNRKHRGMAGGMPRILDRKSVDKRVWERPIIQTWWLMDEGRVDRSRLRGVTGRRGSGGIARERITRSLPVAPARASASGRAAHCPSCFSQYRDRLILLLPLSLLASGPGGWNGLVARFSDPLFHRRPRPPPSSLSLSLSLLLVRESRPLSGAGPRCSETSHNGVTWPLLSRAHTPRSYPIAHTSPLPESHPTEANPLPLPPFSSTARVALCIPPLPPSLSPSDKWGAADRSADRTRVHL